MQGSERDRLTVEVCEAVSAISPAGSHLATTAARLREMVGQEVPAGDRMKEAERLIEEYGNAEWKVGKMSEHSDDAEEIVTRENARAALLAHIQRGAAEHSLEDVRCGCCGYMTYHREHMGCIRAAAPAPDQFPDAAKMMAEPAEVPMPEPDWVTFSRNAEGVGVRVDSLRMEGVARYGAACRAAGEAAGYARGLREMRDCRTCRNYTRDGCIQTAQCVDGDGYRRATPVRFWSAALRGEVKP